MVGCIPAPDEPERSGGLDKSEQQQSVEPGQRAPAEKPEARTHADLTAAETALLRERVKDGLGTTIENDPQDRWFGHRVAVMYVDVEEVHSKKRVATLRLLLEVIKSGTPREALTAAGFADILEGGEEGVLAALEWVDHHPARVDARERDDQRTSRQIMMRCVEHMIAKAQGQRSAEK
jgi:hypothetical protein